MYPDPVLTRILFDPIINYNFHFETNEGAPLVIAAARGYDSYFAPLVEKGADIGSADVVRTLVVQYMYFNPGRHQLLLIIFIADRRGRSHLL
jgi:hypothetical protein